jgi:hypothetical protein
MMHPTIPSLFFIGLFQPIGCIWQLADYPARTHRRTCRRRDVRHKVRDPADPKPSSPKLSVRGSVEMGMYRPPAMGSAD